MTGRQPPNKLGANLTSSCASELEPALEGVAAAGYRYVELTSIRVWSSTCRPMQTRLYLVGERTNAAKIMGVYGSAQAALRACDLILEKYPVAS